jgi:hypothetical protein
VYFGEIQKFQRSMLLASLSLLFEDGGNVFPRNVGLYVFLNGRNIPFVNSIKYLGVIFDKKITWRLHIETIEAKAFRTFSIIYPIFKSERLSANIKLTLHKAFIRLQ